MVIQGLSGRDISILGAGWLGFPLAQSLSNSGSIVKLASRSQQRLDSYKLGNIVGFKIDTENQTANITDFLQSEVLVINITNKNIQAFTQLIDNIEHSPIKKVIFISSTSVYPDNNSIVKEDDGIELVDHPLFIIESLFSQSNCFDTTVIRFSGLIGYERHPGRFFRNSKVVKNAHAKVNLIHRDDCINIINQIIAENIWGEVFNACSDNHPQKQAFYTLAAKAVGNKVPECIVKTEPSFKIVDNQKLKNKLNYQFIHPDVMQLDLTKNEC